MSEQPPPPSGPNGGPITVVTKLGMSVVNSLPAPFLALVLLNIVFIAVVFWFEAHGSENRVAIIGDILRACTAKLEH